MKTTRSARFAFAGLTAVLAAVLLASPTLSGRSQKEHFTGFAISLNGAARTATVDVVIQRWSSDAERDRLVAILTSEKDSYRANEKLLAALQKMPKAGYMRTTNTLAWDLRYARQNPLEDGGRQIVVATDRPVGFREAVNQPRTMDYPFTIAEFRLNTDDRGEGRILAGTKIFIDKHNQLVLENYSQQPVRFNQIKRLK
jgi:hypothetical protein